MRELDEMSPVGVAFISGEIVPILEAGIPITELEPLHSAAVFDVAHVWNIRFFRLDDHLRYFMNAIAKRHIAIDFDRDHIRRILHDCVRASGLKDAHVEMVCTRRETRSDSRDSPLCKDAFYAFVVPFVWIATLDKQDLGLNLRVGSARGIAPQSSDPTVKNHHWLDIVRGRYDAYEEQADIEVLTDPCDNVLEGAGFNVFAIAGHRAATPGEGVRKGVVRQTAMEFLPRMGVAVEERVVSTGELLSADEVFIASAAGGIMPIKFINGRLVGDGWAVKTLRLRHMYWDAHQDPEFSESV